MAQGTGTRLTHIDLLKCFAIYFVLMVHCTLYGHGVWPDMPVNVLLRYFSRTILSASVPLFFFTSGYLLLPRPLKLKKHSLRTLKFIGITCFWTIALLFILQPHYGEYHTWQELRPELWVLKDGWNNQLWYMGALIGLYLLLPLLSAAFQKERKSFYWFTALLMVLIFGRNTLELAVTLLRLFIKKEFYLYSSDFPLFSQYSPLNFTMTMGAAYFCLGGVVWELEPRIRKMPQRWRNLAAGAGVIVSCTMLGILGWRFSLYLQYEWNVVWMGFTTLFTLANVLCLYVLSLSWEKDVPLVRTISANTLGIYLLHDLIHKAIGSHVGQFDFMRTLPGTMVYAAAILLLTLGTCLVIKKLPLVRHLIS